MQVHGNYVPIGLLAEDQVGFRFAYAKPWQTNPDAFSIDPLNLPLGDLEYQSGKRWGCFLDAGADNWGQRVLLATHSQAPANQIEWLISARGTGVGALTLSASRTPLPPIEQAPQFALVSEMMVTAEQLISDGKVDEIAALPPWVARGPSLPLLMMAMSGLDG